MPETCCEPLSRGIVRRRGAASTTDTSLVLSCPYLSLVPVAWRFLVWRQALGLDPVGEFLKPSRDRAAPCLLRSQEVPMPAQQKANASQMVDPTLGLPPLNWNAAGIDVGSTEHWVAVPPGRDPEPVRCFQSFTADLHRLADWLAACGVETVAMESTGVYWLGLFQVLEARGFAVQVVDARRAKSLPGRKSDLLDCQWLQKLHTFGLLTRCFRPADEICVLRSYWRQRETLVAAAATCIQHMQKALIEMNVHLANVLSDLSGTTGRAIVRVVLSR